MSEYINKEGITVISTDLPTAVKGFCYHDDDDRSFIVVNARHSREQQRKTVKHELEHIKRGDMYNPEYKEYD